MKIAIANDHAAYEFKLILIDFLEKQGYSVEDCGSNSSQSCDYPDFAKIALNKVVNKECERAILCCSNGIGMSIIANKTPSIFAALVYSKTSAQNTRKHHESNVLCLGAQEFKFDELLEFTEIWLNTEFEGGRHLRRINKVKEQELNNS